MQLLARRRGAGVGYYGVSLPRRGMFPYLFLYVVTFYVSCMKREGRRRVLGGSTTFITEGKPLSYPFRPIIDSFPLSVYLSSPLAMLVWVIAYVLYFLIVGLLMFSIIILFRLTC